jgi:SAM-dependent methyltransferase
MDTAEGARAFQATGQAYDGFMGRYSVPLAVPFAAAAGVRPGLRALDVGCGPGALTAVLVERLGAGAVAACDPSPPFVAECTARHPGVQVLPGRAEAIPFGDAEFDVALAQLVLHFVSDAPAAAGELRRVLRPGGTAAACVWDFAEGMQMLRLFWDAALTVDPQAPDEARTLRFGREREIVDLFEAAGFVDVVESTLEVSSTYSGFDELWAGFLAGVGPAGSYLVGLDDERRAAVREELVPRVGALAGDGAGFTLTATARCGVGRNPG